MSSKLDTLPKKAMNTIARYPKQAAVLAGLALLFAASSSDDVSPHRADTAETRTMPTSPFLPEDADWSPRYTVETAAGALIDIACRGTSRVTVLAGQTLNELAATIDTRQLGPDLPSVSLAGIVHVLVEANEIQDQDLIYTNQELALPKECAVMNVFVD